MSTHERTTELVEGVLAGHVRSVARAMRLIDDRQAPYLEVLKGLYRHTGRAWVLGVTGTPGAGKSTLTDRLITAFREKGKSVGVVAVDPTSPYSGGAILGDRIRMQRHFLDDGVFIRSLATRGALGGLSRSAGDVIRVLDAAGFDVVIVETVGVGQDELEVTRLAHSTVVVMAPGMGDDIQAIKAGILEVADLFAVNKADREGADATVRDLEQMIALGGVLEKQGGASAGHGHSAAAAAAPKASGASGGRWVPPIVKTVAVKGDGVDELVAAFEQHHRFVFDSEAGQDKLGFRLEQELLAVFRDTLLREAEERMGQELRASVGAIAAGEDNPYSVSERLLSRLLKEGAR